MKNLAAFFCLAFSLQCAAQIPDYVPTDGLVAWWSFNGTTDEEFGLTSESQVAFGEDRFGEGGRALDMLNSTSMYVDYGSAVVPLGQLQSITISLWSKLDDASAYNHFIQHRTDQDVNYNFVLSNNNQGLYAYHGTGNDSLLLTSVLPPTDEWFMLTWTLACDADSVRSSMYLDGALIGQESFGLGCLSSLQSDVLYVGGGYGSENKVKGSIDDLGLWDRPLAASEVLSFYNDSASLEGCTDTAACNYNEEANEDDGSCTYPPFGLADCEAGGALCGVGTLWDDASQTCVTDSTQFSCPTQPIDNSCYFDVSGNGVVGPEDLLSFLASFASTCEVNLPPWACGDPLEYQGYDYATVQIGDQCWFAENLRSENYENGDAIPSNLSDSEWSSTTSGAVAVYGEDAGCDDNWSPDIDVCDPAQSLNEYGRLYNWYAVDDARGLCPSGWHVPTDGEWMTMEMALGMSEAEANGTGWRGTDQGTQMKMTYGWSGGGNGTNASGFSGLPGGKRYRYGGLFLSAGSRGYWWSSSLYTSNAWSRYLNYDYEDVFRSSYDRRFGFSVRCVRDAE